jgi:hypothetical protein
MKHVNFGIASLSLIVTGTFMACTAPPAIAASDLHANNQVMLPVDTGTCTEGAIGYSVSTTEQATSKKSFSDVSGTDISFTQGAAGCVEVSFSAEAGTVAGETLLAQVVLDGKITCEPGSNLFASEGTTDDPADHAMNYICPSVSAGSHSVTVQFASEFGHRVALDYRTTIVRYAP